MKFIFTIILTISNSNWSSASLNKQSIGTETGRADSLYHIGDSMYYRANYLEAISYYLQAFSSYVETDDSIKLSTTLNDVGLSYKRSGQYDSALKYYQRAVEIDKRMHDTVKLIGRYKNIGNTHRTRGNYVGALNAFTGALALAFKTKDPLKRSSIYNSMGNLYYEQQNFGNALDHYMQALTGYQTLKDSLKIGKVYNNIGNVFYLRGQLDSALAYYRNAYIFEKDYGDRNLAYIFNNLGTTFRKKGLFDSAYHYLSKAYHIRSSFNDRRGEAFTANEFAMLHLDLGQRDSARYYLEIAEAYAVDQDNRTILMDNLENRSRYLRQTSQHDDAYTYLERWAAMRDSVFNEERLKVLELQSAFDLEQKEKERQQVEREKEIQEANAWTNLVLSIVLGVFLLISGGFLVVFFRQRKGLRLLNSELNQKNAHITALNRQNFHFTKNSLAELAGMLSLQASRLKDGEVKNTLMAERLRMETINLLYRQLFAQGDEAGGEVDMKPLLTEIINNTVDAIVPLEVPVKLEFDVTPLALPQDKALNLGIIANEVCMNACKFAFRSSGGIFYVRLEEKEGVKCLTLGDSGNGLPKDVDWKSTSSFGLQLIRLMAEDLGAKLSVDSTSSGLFYYFRLPNRSNDQ